jgi:hypothetical protein
VVVGLAVALLVIAVVAAAVQQCSWTPRLTALAVITSIVYVGITAALTYLVKTKVYEVIVQINKDYA